jgi:hypothetical protein
MHDVADDEEWSALMARVVDFHQAVLAFAAIDSLSSVEERGGIHDRQLANGVAIFLDGVQMQVTTLVFLSASDLCVDLRDDAYPSFKIGRSAISIMLPSLRVTCKRVLVDEAAVAVLPDDAEVATLAATGLNRALAFGVL